MPIFVNKAVVRERRRCIESSQVVGGNETYERAVRTNETRKINFY